MSGFDQRMAEASINDRLLEILVNLRRPGYRVRDGRDRMWQEDGEPRVLWIAFNESGPNIFDNLPVENDLADEQRTGDAVV